MSDFFDSLAGAICDLGPQASPDAGCDPGPYYESKRNRVLHSEKTPVDRTVE